MLFTRATLLAWLASQPTRRAAPVYGPKSLERRAGVHLARLHGIEVWLADAQVPVVLGHALGEVLAHLRARIRHLARHGRLLLLLGRGGRLVLVTRREQRPNRLPGNRRPRPPRRALGHGAAQAR